MGVTYKLKQEIVDFIVQKKQIEPSLSCRKLVSLLYQSFQIEVSKSSINAVIKDFNLSNPVGRRPDKPSKNFFIPVEKKQQLLAQVAPFLPTEPAPLVFTQIENKEAVVVPALVETAQTIQDQEDVKDEAVHLTPDLLVQARVELKEEVDWSDEKGLLLENMGLFFVRAFMQDILRRPVLGEVLLRAAGVDHQDVELLEAAIFLKAAQATYPGLAAMFNVDAPKMEQILEQFLGKNVPLNGLCVALEAELGAAFVQGDFFKCVADTGRHFYLSADLSRLLAEARGTGGCFMFKAVEQAVDRMVTTRKPLVFVLPQGLDLVAIEFLTFLDGQAKDRFDKIELWSKESDNVWNFVFKGTGKHNFIGIVHTEVGQSLNIDQLGSGCFYKDAACDREYELKEGTYILDPEKDLKCRAIVVGIPGEDKKTILLTNIPEKDISKVKIFDISIENKAFYNVCTLEDGKNDNKAHVFMGNDQRRTLETILMTIFESFERRWAQSLLVDVIDPLVVQAIYAVHGRIRYQKNFVYVRLEPQKSFSYRTELQTAIDRANCCCMRDYLGRRIIFTLLISADK
jgi:hypothetical protein